MDDWIWIVVPLAAIAFSFVVFLISTYKEWRMFKAKNERLGVSAKALEEQMNGLLEQLRRSDAERQRLLERMQNVETIVTSQAWDALPQGDTRSALPSRAEAGNGAEEAEWLAQRMQT